MDIHYLFGGASPHDTPDVEPELVIVVVPVLNEARHIETCIESLFRDSPFMNDVSVVVADGGSTDGTQDIVREIACRYPSVQLISNPARLQSAAVNLAVETSAKPRHTILVRCDAHAIYPPGYVHRVAKSISDHRQAASLATVMDAHGYGPFSRASAWVVDTGLGSGGAAHRGGHCSGWVDHGHHAGMRLDWFRAIGGYDASFSHNEDAEYDTRLSQAGGRIWLDADIRLGYVMRSTARELARQYWNYGRGRARTVLKHASRPHLRQLTPPINLIVLTASFLLALVWPMALFVPLAYATTLAVVSLAAAADLRDPSGLMAGPALGIIHNAWAAGFLWQVADAAFARRIPIWIERQRALQAKLRVAMSRRTRPERSGR